MLRNGKLALAIHGENGNGLLMMVSGDGIAWREAAVLETEPEAGTPYLLHTGDNRIHVTYSWRQKLVRHVSLDPSGR